MSLAGKTVLVTGASGFTGGALTASLVKAGARVRGLVRSERKGERVAAAGAEQVIGDITDRASLRRAMPGCEIVFHVAAALDGPWARQYAANVNGTGNVAEIAYEAGVRRVVHVSSISTYGFDTPDELTEDTPLRPGIDFYGRTKALAEQRFWQVVQTSGMEGVIVRPGMIYGPGSNFWTRAAFRLVRSLPVPLFGSGVVPCPLISIGDVVDLLLIAAEHPNAVGEAFNAVMDPPPTWFEYLDAYAKMAGRTSYPVMPGWMLRGLAALAEPLTGLLGQPQPTRGQVSLLLEYHHYSAAKAAALLDWRARVSLAEGMAQSAAWLREIGELA